MKSIFNIYQTIGSERKKINLFIFLILISALLEIAGIALVVPVLTLILSSSENINFTIPFLSEKVLSLKKIS